MCYRSINDRKEGKKKGRKGGRKKEREGRRKVRRWGDRISYSFLKYCVSTIRTLFFYFFLNF